jgi:hypothetical protein
MIEVVFFSKKLRLNRYALILSFPIFLPIFTTLASYLEIPSNIGFHLSFVGSGMVFLLLNRKDERFYKKIFQQIPQWFYISPLLLEKRIRGTFFLWVLTVGITLSFLLLQCFVESNSSTDYFVFRGLVIVPLLALRSALSLLCKSPDLGEEYIDKDLVEAGKIIEDIEKQSSLGTFCGVFIFWWICTELYGQGKNVKKRASLAVEEIEKVLQFSRERCQWGSLLTNEERQDILEKTFKLLVRSKRDEFLLHGSHPWTLAGKLIWGVFQNPSSPWVALKELQEVSEEAHGYLKEIEELQRVRSALPLQEPPSTGTPATPTPNPEGVDVRSPGVEGSSPDPAKAVTPTKVRQ